MPKKFSHYIDNPTHQLCNQASTHPIAIFHYQPPISDFIIALKFSHQLAHANFLGYLTAYFMKRYYQSAIPHPETILITPLHTQRLKTRGFNQAVQLAKPISRYLNIPLDRHSVIRHRQTAPQSSLQDPLARRNNVRHAFKLQKPLAAKQVILFDDVLTTGHTLKSLRELLHTTERLDYWLICKAKRK